jgi:predicted RNase H-like nuclease (RuvC/YqgF family)
LPPPQDHQELRTRRAEARRLQQELQLAAARESSLASQLGRSRAEAAELAARLASVQDSSRAAKRSAREALAELAEENAKLVAAFVEKRRELKRLQVGRAARVRRAGAESAPQGGWACCLACRA